MLVLAAAHLAALKANHEGLAQLGELGLALLLSVIVGMERETRQKSAGLRTHAMVGVGAAVFMLISKYGFTDVLVPGRVIVDPSRVAAQIVTGIGFIGAGLIFVRRDGVRGLTTAAGVWVTAAIGAAAGAGLPVLAVVATAAYLIVALGLPVLDRMLPGSRRTSTTVRLRYRDEGGMLREVLRTAADSGFAVEGVAASPAAHDDDAAGGPEVELVLSLRGHGSASAVAAALTELPGASAVATGLAVSSAGDERSV